MKVFSVADKPAPQKTTPKSGKAARRAKRKAAKQPKPPRENVSADQIRARVQANAAKNVEQHKMTKAKLAKFKSEKLADLQDTDKAAEVANKHKVAMIKLGKLAPKKVAEKAEPKGDVGTNDPSDLATHGKLKSVISMGAFKFSDKEKAALEKILKD